ncbi:uncharacterized protein FLJ46347-like [Phasianus colchicus]|uniref:uncharacterized protein FLJ46347-like n=1 Tax=Phasianus colchicus TaxID=9054 RepID=UPI00129D396D|nr:uncharacterized protein FLJ46347-like [Phasianus colchicus]
MARRREREVPRAASRRELRAPDGAGGAEALRQSAPGANRARPTGGGGRRDRGVQGRCRRGGRRVGAARGGGREGGAPGGGGEELETGGKVKAVFLPLPAHAKRPFPHYIYACRRSGPRAHPPTCRPGAAPLCTSDERIKRELRSVPGPAALQLSHPRRVTPKRGPSLQAGAPEGCRRRGRAGRTRGREAPSSTPQLGAPQCALPAVSHTAPRGGKDGRTAPAPRGTAPNPKPSSESAVQTPLVLRPLGAVPAALRSPLLSASSPPRPPHAVPSGPGRVTEARKGSRARCTEDSALEMNI